MFVIKALKKMKIKLNGKEVETGEAGTLLALLEKYELQDKALVVEHNGVVIKSGQYEGVRLNEGDLLEIVRLVGGG
jgi:sulfur carrier protein